MTLGPMLTALVVGASLTPLVVAPYFVKYGAWRNRVARDKLLNGITDAQRIITTHFTPQLRYYCRCAEHEEDGRNRLRWSI